VVPLVEYEESFIKCYARKGSDGEILGYQRRVLLSSNGKLGGCPEDTDPRPVLVLWKDDFLRVKEGFSIYQEAETRLKKEVDNLNGKVDKLESDLKDKEDETHQLKQELKQVIDDKEHENQELKRELTLYQEAETRTKKELQELTESNHQLKQGIDDKELEIRKAIAFIGVAWAGIQDLKKRSWWERLRGGIPESLIQLQKPPSEIFPLPEDLILLEDETTPGEVE